MAAGKQSSSSVTISYDDAQGGSPQTITGSVLTIGALKLTANMQVSTAFGDTITKQLPTGLVTVDKVTFHGFFDDTATVGPHIVFGSGPDKTVQGGTRTLAIVVGNSKTWTSEGYVESYSVIGKTNNLTEYEAVCVQNTGAWT
jgi:hypothetical protein